MYRQTFAKIGQIIIQLHTMKLTIQKKIDQKVLLLCMVYSALLFISLFS